MAIHLVIRLSINGYGPTETEYTFSANVRHLSELSETKVLGRFCGRPIC